MQTFISKGILSRTYIPSSLYLATSIRVLFFFFFLLFPGSQTHKDFLVDFHFFLFHSLVTDSCEFLASSSRTGMPKPVGNNAVNRGFLNGLPPPYPSFFWTHRTSLLTHSFPEFSLKQGLKLVASFSPCALLLPAWLQ